jgi:hypothetical protein
LNQAIVRSTIHGLTAETVITTVENAADYQIFEATIYAEYQPRTAAARELVARLASVLWRLRGFTSIETRLMQIQGALMRSRYSGRSRRRGVALPEWYDGLDVAPTDGAEAILSDSDRDDGSARVGCAAGNGLLLPAGHPHPVRGLRNVDATRDRAMAASGAALVHVAILVTALSNTWEHRGDATIGFVCASREGWCVRQG